MLDHLLVLAIPLGIGLALALVAVWRGWAPPLPVAVTAGLALRIYVAAVARHDVWQPSDFDYQFTAAVVAFFHHQDPLSLPNSEWHFLPTMVYVNAGAYRLGELTHLPWEVVGRVVPVAADTVLILLVGVLAGRGKRRRLAAFQYALNPLAVMISAIHGQVEPVAIAFGVGALILVLRPRQHAAASGVLLGLAIAVNSWPALLIPGLLRALPGWRKRVTALAGASAVPVIFLVTGPLLIGFPAHLLRHDIRALLTARGVIGDWGWTVLVTHGHETIDQTWARLGAVILVLVLCGTWYLWRRAHPVDLVAALSLAFMVSSDRVAAQYLIWPVPGQIARPSRGTQLSLVACSAWAGAGYLWLSHAPTDQAWSQLHRPWAFSSLFIVPILAFAMPWRRRTQDGAPDLAIPGAPAREPQVPAAGFAAVNRTGQGPSGPAAQGAAAPGTDLRGVQPSGPGVPDPLAMAGRDGPAMDVAGEGVPPPGT